MVRNNNPRQEGVIRVRLPKKGEIFGVVTALLGGSRLRVECADGKERMVRIPGRLKRQAWVRVGDVVLVVPWEIDNSKADLAWRYTRLHVQHLKAKRLFPDNLL